MHHAVQYHSTGRTLFIRTSIIRTHQLTECQIYAATPIKHC